MFNDQKMMAMSLSMNKRENCQTSKNGFDKALTLYEGRHFCVTSRLSKNGGKRAIVFVVHKPLPRWR
jgi:hypothetical protein